VTNNSVIAMRRCQRHLMAAQIKRPGIYLNGEDVSLSRISSAFDYSLLPITARTTGSNKSTPNTLHHIPPSWPPRTTILWLNHTPTQPRLTSALPAVALETSLNRPSHSPSRHPCQHHARPWTRNGQAPSSLVVVARAMSTRAPSGLSSRLTKNSSGR